jgi:hypothetical protein|nr:DUF2256 domain-containing protein [Vitreimonas flagellata]
MYARIAFTDRRDEAKQVVKNANGKRMDKANLPQKTCATCGRPFSWRKKWARDWDAIKYCSQRCRDAS